MDDKKKIIEQLIAAIERLLPEFLQEPADVAIADGNVALLIVDDSGAIYGKMLGANRNKQRDSCRVAWQKALQVWITGVATGRYEELVYSNRLNWWEYGIPKPEFVGWEGGLPLKFSDGSLLTVAFSGFRGEIDCEIIRRAVAQIPQLSLV